VSQERGVMCKCAGWRGWRETEGFKGKICKEILKICRFGVFGVAQLDLDRSRRRGTILCLAVKYRLRILHMGRYELTRDWDDRKYKISNLEQGR